MMKWSSVSDKRSIRLCQSFSSMQRTAVKWIRTVSFKHGHMTDFYVAWNRSYQEDQKRRFFGQKDRYQNNGGRFISFIQTAEVQMQQSIVIFLSALVVVTVLSKLSFAIPVCPIKSVGLKNEDGATSCWKCPECEHGMGLSVECGRTYPYGTKVECQPCKKGLTYSTTRDIGQCKQCQRCSDNEESKGTCTEFEDSVTCRCKTGCYRDPVHKDCISCSTCCVGNRTAKVPECNSLCSFVLGSICAIADTISNTSKKQFNNTETNNETYDMGTKPTGHKEQSPTIWPYFAFPGLLIVCGSLVFYVYRKRRNSQTVGNQSKSTESTSDTYQENESAQMIADASATTNIAPTVSQLQVTLMESNGTDDSQCSTSSRHAATIAPTVSPLQVTLMESNETDDSQCSTSSRHAATIAPTVSSLQGAAGTSCMAQSSIVNNDRERVLLQERINSLPSNITDIYIKDLHFKIRNELCMKLDIIHPMAKDFRGVAGSFDIHQEKIKRLAQMENPTSALFDILGSQLKRVSHLINSLVAIERLDILQWLLDELERENSLKSNGNST